VFQLIHRRLRYFKIDRELRTLAIASAVPREGKTTIARHLASVAVTMGSAVLLIEADLRRPALASQLALQPGPGLSDVLIGEVSLWSATQLVDIGTPPPDDAAENSLAVLVAGALSPPNPSDLIASRAMAMVLEQAKETYDLIVLDTSSLCVFPDAFPLLEMVDGAIIVGRVGRRRRRTARRLGETLAGTDAPLLGVVANFCVRRWRDPHAHDNTSVPGDQRPAPLSAEHAATERGGPGAADSPNGTSSVTRNPPMGRALGPKGTKRRPLSA
jgi:capsular exopolysaccharide synthesis family protein